MSKINDRLLASENKFILCTMYNDATLCTFLESIMGSNYNILSSNAIETARSRKWKLLKISLFQTKNGI